MGKGRMPKCKYCEQDIVDKEKSIKKNGKYFHLDCFEKLEAEKAKLKEENKSDREKLTDYIHFELYDYETPVFVFKQIEDYKRQYGFTYMGMLLCLKYMYEILNMPFDKDRGIGLIIYYYDKAKKHWLESKQLQQAIDEFEFDEKIERVTRTNSNNKYFDKMKNRFSMEDV